MITGLAHLGELAALATAACWAMSAILFEAAGRRLGSLTVNLLRLIVGFAMLSVAAWFLRDLAFPLDASPHAWFWLSASGIAGFLVGDLCLFRAYVVLGPRLSSVMMSLTPVFTTVIGRMILGESLSARDLLGMTLTVTGVAWAILDRGGSVRGLRPERPLTGIALGLGGAIGQATGLVLSKLGMGSYDALAATQIRVLAGIVGFAGAFFVLRWWSNVAVALRDRKGLHIMVWGAVFGTFMGVTLSLVAVKYAKAGVAASIMATTPIILIPLVWFVRSERVGWGGIAGTFLAVGGVALLFL